MQITSHQQFISLPPMMTHCWPRNQWPWQHISQHRTVTGPGHFFNVHSGCLNLPLSFTAVLSYSITLCSVLCHLALFCPVHCLLNIKLGLSHSPQSRGLAKIQLMTDGVDADMSCLYRDASHMTTGKERQCFLRNLLTLQMSITSQRWHGNWVRPRCTMLCFFVFFFIFLVLLWNTLNRGKTAETNSSGDVTVEIKSSK